MPTSCKLYSCADLEHLCRRFGQEAFEAKMAEFMRHDADGNNAISFSEFLQMDRKHEHEMLRKHAGFRFAQALVNTTKQENDRILGNLRSASSKEAATR